MLRFLLAFSCLAATSALAESDCEDTFIECRDDCQLEFGGSVRVEMKKRFDKCMKKCTKTANQCTERVMETRAGNLDDGALENAPTSDQVDEHGMPTSTAGRKKKQPAPASADREPADDDAPAPKKAPLEEGDVPRSSRTQLKTEAPKPAPKSEPPPAEPDAARTEVIELKPRPRKEEEDLRDDGARSAPTPKTEAPRDEAPPPPKKKEKKEEPPPKKKEEDHDDLRFY